MGTDISSYFLVRNVQLSTDGHIELLGGKFLMCYNLSTSDYCAVNHEPENKNINSTSYLKYRFYLQENHKLFLSISNHTIHAYRQLYDCCSLKVCKCVNILNFWELTSIKTLRRQEIIVVLLYSRVLAKLIILPKNTPSITLETEVLTHTHT